MSGHSLAALRVAVGLAQGIILCVLYQASEDKVWPVTDGVLFAALLVPAIFAPTVFIAAVGSLRIRTLAIWIPVVVALCAGAGAYDIFRDPIEGWSTPTSRAIPGFTFWVAITAMLFVSHSLVAAADADRKPIAGYPTYFDVSWKLGVQFTLAALFTGLLWGLLFLGAELFKLITLHFLSEWLRRPWFSIPVTLIAFSCAVHVTDVRAGLVTGARTLKLTLEAWLLPVMTAFVLVFLIALPVIGLAPLWGTRKATMILLWSAAVLIFLINAAYQDGHNASRAVILRYSRLIAAVALVPLAALAGYALMLRVQQYGWTPQRVFAFATLVVICCYAAGYTFAALRSQTALRQLEITNVLAAGVIVAALIALFSPIADPARISAADQVERILSGKIAPEKFDGAFLRFNAGRYGVAALQRLIDDPATPAYVVGNAKRVAQMRSQSEVNASTTIPPAARATPESRAANIAVVHASIRSLPDDFLREEWLTEPGWMLPRCLTGMDKCSAIFADLDGDGQDEVVLLPASGTGVNGAFRKEAGKWVLLGSLSSMTCGGVADALRANRFDVAAPVLREIEANGFRLRVGPRSDRPCERRPR